MQSLEGFILAGGASRRMGTDKSKLTLSGQTFIERVATALSAVTNEISVVGGGQHESASLLQHNLPIVPDIHENWGALGGLHAAFTACRAEWAVIVACDLPFVTGALLRRLASLSTDLADCQAVAPVQSDGRPQPLCAVYRVSPCVKIAEELIKSGEHRPLALLQSARTRWVAFAELADLDGAKRFFDNLNAPGDYDRARQTVGG
jgi:molybdopterin-guanine dinucleotide biosynthesis protein A